MRVPPRTLQLITKGPSTRYLLRTNCNDETMSWRIVALDLKWGVFPEAGSLGAKKAWSMWEMENIIFLSLNNRRRVLCRSQDRVATKVSTMAVPELFGPSIRGLTDTWLRRTNPAQAEYCLPGKPNCPAFIRLTKSSMAPEFKVQVLALAHI